ncbi:MAG TPA: Hsp20/alpha crystallin family protein [Steroidobacteraceae bacterium]|nr:Hsp20/alpha crystallin family protein [Steroidobacteraceae bacterium]
MAIGAAAITHDPPRTFERPGDGHGTEERPVRGYEHGDNLVVEGRLELELSESAEALYADVRSSLYLRSFALSAELEPEKIEATLKDGVLTVHIPKRAELRPKEIEVKVG